jgi:dihydroorotate dehydrogenase (NAD+) catalytic subunit
MTDGIDLTTSVGAVALRGPVLTASGTAGHGDELAAYVALDSLGAVVVKSLRADPWPGNPAPRVHETSAGMINSVGLQGPGVEAWLTTELPAVLATGATVVASIWGTTVDDYRRAAVAIADAPPEVVAVEINVSCPNHHAHDALFAYDPAATAEVVAATEACGRPRWVKLSASPSLVAVAGAAADAGADAAVLINTVPGLALDLDRRSAVLGNGGGGLSGPAIHPIAVRAVWDVHVAHPSLPIVGVGGVARGEDAVELMMAGASAVEVGTATFADPRAVAIVAGEVAAWCRTHGVRSVRELIGAAHG